MLLACSISTNKNADYHVRNKMKYCKKFIDENPRSVGLNPDYS